ncbi:hypothetical protein HMPREF1210_01162 [Paenisporosarcina sp. HGH0030]|uniref:hypothetical protein n=1 Tax=Paenisporosarcina sp. HGH0030 TaxID=1078085 RepID=UPI00034E6A22|nr:hypothetical protein [Paenisporosarcina sp. HGH0030]EPD52782.1 hypothetical protein HMPREF1210_01162 [Paenisporosarcina sp. HGH0030]
MATSKITVEVEILNVKKGVPTVIRMDGHQYSLQHPSQMKIGVEKPLIINDLTP